MPGKPGPHPALRQGAHSGPPAPPPGSHPDPARRGDRLGSWGWILHEHQRPHCFSPPTARGQTPPPTPLLCLACLPLPRTRTTGSQFPAPLSTTPPRPRETSPVRTGSPEELGLRNQASTQVWTQATPCQPPNSSFFRFFNYNYYFNNNLKPRTSRHCPYALPWAVEREHFEGNKVVGGVAREPLTPPSHLPLGTQNTDAQGGKGLGSLMEGAPASTPSRASLLHQGLGTEGGLG